VINRARIDTGLITSGEKDMSQRKEIGRNTSGCPGNHTIKHNSPAADGCCQPAEPATRPESASCCNGGEKVPDPGSASCCRPGERTPDSREPPEDLPAHVRDGFHEAAVGPVPRVHTRLVRQDAWGTFGARIGFGRGRYRIPAGLYAVGRPDADSPVLVTANYKLSFDHLRRHLSGRDAWLLLLDTKGINVWCAAGKGTFGTDEICRQVGRTALSEVVRHRRLILPQLGAPGVTAREVLARRGFRVVWGPVRAADLPAWLDNEGTTNDRMRRVTFSLRDRVTLIPVELYLLGRYIPLFLVAAFALSAIGPGFFDLRAALVRGSALVLAAAAGILAGAVLVPALLPWIPGRAFSGKGFITGALVSPLVIWPYVGVLGLLELGVLGLATVLVSADLAMNFTGSTPFTSPSGVEKEMRWTIPGLALGVVAVLAGWIAGPFMG
jgi:hypothetical protein